MHVPGCQYSSQQEADAAIASMNDMELVRLFRPFHTHTHNIKTPRIASNALLLLCMLWLGWPAAHLSVYICCCRVSDVFCFCFLSCLLSAIFCACLCMLWNVFSVDLPFRAAHAASNLRIAIGILGLVVCNVFRSSSNRILCLDGRRLRVNVANQRTGGGGGVCRFFCFALHIDSSRFFVIAGRRRRRL